MTDMEKRMSEEYYYCKLIDGQIIDFKDRESCLHYFRSHKSEVEPYGCGFWRWDQARHFILIDSFPKDDRRFVEERCGPTKNGTFLYW